MRTEPLRILHIVSGMNYAGIETLLMEIYRNIDRKKVQFDFLLHNDLLNDYESEIEQLGGKVFRIQKYSMFGLKAYEKRLEEFFLQHSNYRMVHSHLNTFSKYALRAAKKGNVRFRIAHSHASTPSLSLNKLLKQVNKINLNKYANYKFACSIKAANWLFNTTKDVIIFNNAINTNKFRFDYTNRREIRNKLNLEDENLLIGHVGGFRYEKNHEFLIDIFSVVHKENCNARLLLLGNGFLEKKIKDKVDNLNLNNYVFFINKSDRVNKYMHAMDVLVFPSIVEGLGIVTIESQASGLTTIVSDSIPKETNITPLIEYISLDKSAKFWANRILNTNASDLKNREAAYSLVRKSGYDIESQSKWLENFYLNISKSES